MKLGTANVKEIYADGSAQLQCAAELIPSPGQYLLADLHGSDSPLVFSLYPAESTPAGFRSAPLIPSTWVPGAELLVRGPIGHGFALPVSARKVALIAYDDSPARLRGLLSPAFHQGAEVVLLCNAPINDFPEAVEIQPLPALRDILKWADYIAADLARENLQQFKVLLGGVALPEMQVLIRAPMPCGGLAECGVCAVTVGRHWLMTCKDGPVFRMEELG